MKFKYLSLFKIKIAIVVSLVLLLLYAIQDFYNTEIFSNFIDIALFYLYFVYSVYIYKKYEKEKNPKKVKIPLLIALIFFFILMLANISYTINSSYYWIKAFIYSQIIFIILSALTVFLLYLLQYLKDVFKRIQKSLKTYNFSMIFNNKTKKQIEDLEKRVAFIERLFSIKETPYDQYYESAKKLLKDTKSITSSFIQRRLGLGYARSAKILDQLEEEGLIGKATGSKPRKVLKK